MAARTAAARAEAAATASGADAAVAAAAAKEAARIRAGVARIVTARAAAGQRKQGGGNRQKNVAPVEAVTPDEPVELDESDIKRRRGRRRKGRPIGRYQMCVSQQPEGTHIAVLEGRSLVEHYVSRPTDDINQIHGNIYLGRVQNVLPGMEAAFVDIGTPKNAVLYRGDVQYDQEDIVEGGKPRIEELLKAKQTILCQVTKNPIAHKGARLTQEVSLPGRFVVLVPNSATYGISKRLPDDERKRLRKILDKARPEGSRPHRAHRGRGHHGRGDHQRRRAGSSSSGSRSRSWRRRPRRPACSTASPRWRCG